MVKKGQQISPLLEKPTIGAKRRSNTVREMLVELNDKFYHLDHVETMMISGKFHSDSDFQKRFSEENNVVKVRLCSGALTNRFQLQLSVKVINVSCLFLMRLKCNPQKLLIYKLFSLTCLRSQREYA